MKKVLVFRLAGMEAIFSFLLTIDKYKIDHLFLK